MKRIQKWLNIFQKILGTYKIHQVANAMLFRGTIEDCEWLKYKSFSPGSYAMDNAALYTLFRILNDVKPRNILEFGLGQSSRMIHQFSTYNQGCRAITIEHDIAWRDFFLNGIPKEINMDVRIHETALVKYNGFETLSYKDMETILAVDYDFIVVDGPFGSRHYSRSQILGLVNTWEMGGHFCIFMDDTERKGEQETLNMLGVILRQKGIKFHVRHYTGEKNQHSVICSENLKFLTSLR
jgi:hypothetical protein